MLIDAAMEKGKKGMLACQKLLDDTSRRFEKYLFP